MASNPPPDTSLFIDTTMQNSLSGSLPPPPTIGSLGGVLDNIPGVAAIEDLLQVVSNTVTYVAAAIKAVEADHPLTYVLRVMQYIDHIETALGFPSPSNLAAGATWFSHIVNFGSGKLIEGMLNEGLGVDTSQFDDDGKRGIQTADKILTFAALVELGVGAMNAVGEPLLANRWIKAAMETLSKLPEEMGLSWALGIVISENFKTAIGTQLERNINREKRPNEPEWKIARMMLKQHVLEPADMQTILENAGFSQDWIDKIDKLADVVIPVGDIAQLWYRDIIDDARALDMIKALGFNDEQAGWLFDLYVAKSENEASVTYRSIARQMFTNHLIPESQYRSILGSANYPAKLIDQDVAAITFEQSVGRVLESVAVVKSLYQHKRINAAEAQTRLRSLNYSDVYIGQLIQTWDLPALRAKHGLSQAKILSYVISGIPLNPPALDQLMATGLDQASAQFLLDHPHANTGVHQHQLTPGLVTQAFLDGAITQAGLGAAYTAAGVPQSDLTYYEDIAKYKLAHHRGSPTYTQTLTDADIRAGFKQGLIDFQTGVSMLQQNGWDSHDAMFLMEITNKGPYKAPLFATLQDAIAYLQSLFYIVTPPADPRLYSAIAMVEGAGYGVSVGGAGTHPIIPPILLPPP